MRLTCWFNARERVAIEREAQRQNTTLNFIVRTAVRNYLRMDRADNDTSVTGVTRNNRD